MSEILLDPITEFNQQTKLAEKAKNDAIDRMKNDQKLFKKWCKDDTRVQQFTSKYKDFQNSHHEHVVEVFITYPEKKGNLIFDTATGLTPSQEADLRLYPFVKDMHTGKVYGVSRYYSENHYNEEQIATWEAIRAEKPSFTVPRPPEYFYGFDRAFNNKRFDPNPFSLKMTPERYYTFMIPQIVLGPEVNVIM